MPRPLPETPPEVLAHPLEHAEGGEGGGPVPRRRGWRRWIWWVAIPLVVFGVGAVSSVLLPRNRTTVIPVEDTVTKYRNAGPGTFSVAGLPEPGVYVYETSGTEHVNALGGGSHRYPSQTTMTVTVAQSYATTRWDALQQRWDEYGVCLEGRAQRAQHFAIYHNFFLKSDFRDYVCPAEAVFLPADHSVGTTWTARCVAGDATSTNHGRILGTDSLTVGREEVEALHLRLDTDLGGSTSGTRHAEAWPVPDTGLTLKSWWTWPPMPTAPWAGCTTPSTTRRPSPRSVPAPSGPNGPPGLLY